LKVNQAFRYELKPNIEQRILLAKHAGAARFAYNWGLQQRIHLFETLEEKSRFPTSIEQHKVLNSLKASDFPWMYEVSKCAPQEALRDLDKAFKNFTTLRKKGKKIGFPKFKKKGVKDRFRLTGSIKVNTKTIQLPRIGLIRLKEHTGKFSGRILSATVSREVDRWFVSLTVETEKFKPDLSHQREAVGIDVGLTTFAALSDGTKIDAPKPLNRSLKRLKRLSKKHSRKVKCSQNRKKSAFQLARLHRRIKNQRRDFLHKTSTQLAKTKSVIVIENLNIKGMLKNHSLARHIIDAGWGEFRRMLEYKGAWYGSLVELAPRFFASSKTCSCCGYVMAEMPLNIRSWTCPNCHTTHERDVNAAKNLLNLSTASSAGINACEDSSNGTLVNPNVSYESQKQEATSGRDICP
jgi:putative transposase